MVVTPLFTHGPEGLMNLELLKEQQNGQQISQARSHRIHRTHIVLNPINYCSKKELY